MNDEKSEKDAQDETLITLADGSVMRRVRTDEDGNPIEPYDAKIAHVDLGGPPRVSRIPEVRVLDWSTDARNGEIAELVLACPARLVFPNRVDVEVDGATYRVVDPKARPSMTHTKARKGEAIFTSRAEPV